MRKKDAERLIHAPGVDERVRAHAADALRELWDRTVDNATEDPRTRVVTPSMVKKAIDERLAAVLGPGVLPPIVEVRVNADRTGFEVEIRAPLNGVKVVQAS